MQLVPVIDFYTGKTSGGKAAAAISQGHWNNWNWCFLIVITGAVILSVRLIIQYFSFLNIRNKAQLLSESDTRVYHVDADIIPFSFGNSIFINKQLHSVEELQEIVRHEFVHVKQKHSIDIFWSELLCILSWYNPFSWLLKGSVRQNLEFIADGKVLESGMNRKEYQYLLLKVIGNNHFSIASKFNFSSLKKRITMMNKMKTARVHVFRFLFILPLIGVLLIAFRKKEHPENSARLQGNVPKAITLSTADIAYASDTTPKPKADKKQVRDRSGDRFEITDKKAVIYLRNGKREEYDLTDSVQRRNFEANYGKIISVAADADELAPVTVVTATSATVAESRPVIEAPITTSVAVTAAPVAVTTANGETVIVAKTGTAVTASAPTIVTPVSSPRGVAVIDDKGYAITGDEDVLVTITRNTTATQLEDLKKQMREKGYEIKFDKTTYNDKGILTHISGTIKSEHGQDGNFSATDFEKLILAEVRENYRTYLRIEIVDKKKQVI